MSSFTFIVAIVFGSIHISLIHSLAAHRVNAADGSSRAAREPSGREQPKEIPSLAVQEERDQRWPELMR